MSMAKPDAAYADSNADLVQAVWRSDLSEVQRRLEQGADARARDIDTGLTVLMIAAGCGAAEVVSALLDAGADVFATDSGAGATPLHKACQSGSLAVAKLLVERGAFVDAAVPTTGHTPLLEAMWFAWPDVVEYLLTCGARLGNQTSYGFALQQHYEYELAVNLAARDRVLAIGELIERRRDDDRQAVEAQALMAAVVVDDLTAVKRLLADGAPVDARSPMLSSFNDAHTPLLVAARDGHAEIVAALLGAGADVNAMEPTFLAVPLHKSVYNGHVEITRMLAHQPGVRLNVQGATNGYTPLNDALWHGYAECAEILVAAGARLDLRGHDGKTALDLAIESLGTDHPLTRLIEARAGG
jgi:ankyrin repeat protein